MLTVTGKARVYLHGKAIDMRKSFEGLGKLVEENFEAELLSGSYFAFINRRRDRIKVLYWDTDGLAIWYKRLEKGAYSAACDSEGELSRRQFLMLLEGVTPKRLNKRYSIK